MNLSKHIFRILALIASLFALIGLASPSLAAASPAYDPNNLLSNYVFRDTSTMSASDIKTFLASKGSYLANTKTYQETCTNSFMNSVYAHCGQNLQASQIIYDTAHAMGMNPRVILATLQKEQSLVTDPSPSASQLNCAMGYNSCSGYSGFFTQVDNGTFQLRYNYEASQGNTWSAGGSSFPATDYQCTTAKAGTSLYTADIRPGNTVTFKDPGGTAKTVTIANAATASLYCYTPYVGPISQTGYSGSYNFVIDFETWFGYYYLSSQNGPPTQLEYGATTTVQFVVVNNSNQTWYSDGHTPSGVHPYRLMTLGYVNTPFADTSSSAWLGTRNQVKMVENNVAPGSTATFNVPLKAPQYTMSTNLAFILVQDGVQVHGDQILYAPTTSLPPYGYSVVSVNVPPGILPGDAYNIVIQLKNTGTRTWYSDSDRSDPNNTGSHPTRLASLSGNSPYAYPNISGTNWLNQNVIQMQGTSVPPKSIGTFKATIFAPYQSTSYTHNFKLILAGVQAMEGPVIPAKVWTPSPIATYSIVSKSIPATMTSGTTATATVVLKNTGNMIWRNIHRKVSGTSTSLPLRDVRMMSWAPAYHTSAFWAGTPEWIGSKNQITPTSAIVGPGKTATYSITIKAPPVSKKTFYNEQWNLVLDGAVVMPFQSLAFPITVTP